MLDRTSPRRLDGARKTRVLIIGPNPPPYNGMSVATDLVLKAIQDQFSSVHLDTADRRCLSNIGKIDAVNVILAGYHGLKYLWLLLTRRPDIVYVPIAQNNLGFLRDCLFLIPARMLRKRVVIHLHGGCFDKFYKAASPAMQGIIRFALGRTARAIVLGPSLAHIFDGIIPRERVRVVPNGLDDNFSACGNVTPSGHRRTVLFLSTLMKEKGMLDVLKAVPAVAKSVPDVRVVFAGEWFRRSDQETAQELVQKLRLKSQVEFVGRVVPPFKYELLRKADIFVLPSYDEGHPFALLEAMSAGLPVVATKVGGIPETVIDGVNGFLLEPGDRRALAEGLVLLLTDEDLRRKMSEASRKRFLAHYTFERFSEYINCVFREFICQRDDAIRYEAG